MLCPSIEKLTALSRCEAHAMQREIDEHTQYVVNAVASAIINNLDKPLAALVYDVRETGFNLSIDMKDHHWNKEQP